MEGKMLDRNEFHDSILRLATLILFLFALTWILMAMLWYGSAKAETWFIPDYLPNIPMRAANFQQRSFITSPPEKYGLTEINRAYSLMWNSVSSTGIYYISVNEIFGSQKCLHGDIQGAHPNFATAGNGFDFYAWTPNGLLYMGNMFWYEDCSYNVASVPASTGVLALRTFDDTGPDVTLAYILSLDSAKYDADGNFLSFTQGTPFTTYITFLSKDMIKMKLHTCPLHNAGPPCYVYHVNFLSGGAQCNCGECWNPANNIIQGWNKGVWKSIDHTDVNTSSQMKTPLLECSFTYQGQELGWFDGEP